MTFLSLTDGAVNMIQINKKRYTSNTRVTSVTIKKKEESTRDDADLLPGNTKKISHLGISCSVRLEAFWCPQGVRNLARCQNQLYEVPGAADMFIMVGIPPSACSLR